MIAWCAERGVTVERGLAGNGLRLQVARPPRCLCLARQRPQTDAPVSAADRRKDRAIPSHARGRLGIREVLLVRDRNTPGLTICISLASTATGNESVGMKMLVGLGAWLAFSASTLLQHNTFELKPPMPTIINTGYQLVMFLAMAVVIGLL